MATGHQPDVLIPETLLEQIRAFPTRRDVEHCGASFSADPFDIYARCPRCGTPVKVRSFSAGGEVEDIFDAVFEWMNGPGARSIADRRGAALADDE